MHNSPKKLHFNEGNNDDLDFNEGNNDDLVRNQSSIFVMKALFDIGKCL